MKMKMNVGNIRIQRKQCIFKINFKVGLEGQSASVQILAEN